MLYTLLQLEGGKSDATDDTTAKRDVWCLPSLLCRLVS